MKTVFQSKEAKILTVIFLVALLLRMWGINFGLPRLYLEDEEFFVQPALRVASGKLDPKWYGAPGHPLIYGTAAIFRVVNKITNIQNNTEYRVDENYSRYVSEFQTAGRALPAFLGALSVIPMYLIGSRWSKRAGLWGAGLAATSFYLIDESHIIRPDIAQTFFILWMMFFAVRIFENPKRWSSYILLGISFGLGITMKYPTLFLFAPLLVFIAALLKTKSCQPRQWIAAGTTAIASAFLSGPYLFLNFQRMLHDVGLENRANQAGHDFFNWGQNLWWYFSHVLQFQIGTFMSLMIAITLVYIIRRFLQKRDDQRFSIFFGITLTALAYLFLISALKLHWERWIIPVLTLGFVFAGIGIDLLLQIQKRRLLTSLVLLALFLAPGVRLIRTMYGFSVPGTIEVARDWILKNIPQKTILIREPYTPQIPEDLYTVVMVPNLSWYDPGYYRAQNAEYFVISESIHGRIEKEAARLGDETDFGKAMRRYVKLFRESTLVQDIPVNKKYSTDQSLMSNDLSILRTADIALRKGPEIQIYRLNPK